MPSKPIMQPAELHSNRSDNILKMGARLSNVAQVAQSHPTNALSHGLLRYLLTWRMLAETLRSARVDELQLRPSVLPVFVSREKKSGYPVGRIPAFPLCRRLKCLRVVCGSVAMGGVVIPGSMRYHIGIPREHCWHSQAMQFPDSPRRPYQPGHSD